MSYQQDGFSLDPLFNTGGPKEADNASVNYVYCRPPCPQFCDLDSCGLNCVSLDPCTYRDNNGCPEGSRSTINPPELLAWSE